MWEEGDSLWRIAERELGDGHRWQEIFAANHGRRMPDGQLLRDGGLICPAGSCCSHPTTQPTAARHARPAPVDPGPVAGRPEPPPPPATPSPSPGPASTTAEHRRRHADGEHAERRDIVELPSGSMVGISLAVGIAAALVVAGLRRRRRRRPLWPPAPSERAAGRDGGDRPAAGLCRRPGHPPGRRCRRAAARRAAAGAACPAQRDPAIPPRPGSPSPSSTAGRSPSTWPASAPSPSPGWCRRLGSRCAGWAAGRRRLGRGGGAAGRRAAHLRRRRLPGLRRAAGLPGALNVLEAELVHRARLLEANDTLDFATHRREHPDDPLPALVLVADGVSLEQAGRLAAILAQGPRLGVGALLPAPPSTAAPSWCWTRPAGCRPRPLGAGCPAAGRRPRLLAHPARSRRAAGGAGPLQDRRRRC